MPGIKNPKLILNNNEFVIHQRSDVKTRWRCNRYSKVKGGCKAALLTRGKVVYMYYSHNHDPPAGDQVKQGTIYVGAGRKHPKLIFENNDYSFHSREQGKTRWRCLYHYKTKCRSALYTYGKVVNIISSHNHPQALNPNSLESCTPMTVTIVRTSKNK